VQRVPSAVRRTALSAFNAREPDAVVADLAHDCVRHVPEPPSRHLQFRSATCCIDVEVRWYDAGHLALRVRTIPDAVVHVRVRRAPRQPSQRFCAWSELEVDRDPGGELTPVRRGMISLLCTIEGAPGGVTQTAWVRL
jgi:hypothetical protein